MIRPLHLRHHTYRGEVVGRVFVIRVLYGRFFLGGIVSVGYAIAHPRLNPVGILPPGSRPSDVAAVCIIGLQTPMPSVCANL